MGMLMGLYGVFIIISQRGSELEGYQLCSWSWDKRRLYLATKTHAGDAVFSILNSVWYVWIPPELDFIQPLCINFCIIIYLHTTPKHLAEMSFNKLCIWTLNRFDVRLLSAFYHTASDEHQRFWSAPRCFSLRSWLWAILERRGKVDVLPW